MGDDKRQLAGWLAPPFLSSLVRICIKRCDV